MILFKALKQDIELFQSGGLIDQMIKHPRKAYYKFIEGKFNINDSATEIENKNIVSSSFPNFIADIIGTSFKSIDLDQVSITKVDNYFLCVYNFKSNDESFSIIYDINSLDECTYKVSVIIKFVMLEDVSDIKSTGDISDQSGVDNVKQVYNNPEPQIIQEPVVQPIQSAPQPTIHEQSAMGHGGPVVDEYDTAMNDNKYTPPQPI